MSCLQWTPTRDDSTAVTELRQFEGRGHSLTIDHGWREVADAVLGWLKENGV
jgi:hypothetical protein